MTIHFLKTDHDIFLDVKSGKKLFEFRRMTETSRWVTGLTW